MKGKRYAKSGSILIAMLTVLTVFSVMTTVSAGNVHATASNVQSMVKVVSISPNDIKYVSGPNGHYVIVKGMRLTGSPGNPALPVKGLKFKLPYGAKISGVSLSASGLRNFGSNLGSVKISPASAPVLKDGYKIPAKFSPPAVNKKVYDHNGFYPEKNMIYRVDNNGKNTYVYVYLFPVRYNPVKGEVQYYSNMKVTVEYTLTSADVRATPPINVPNIIITSPELKAQAQRLADFHNSTGVTSYVVTTTWIASHFTPASNPPLNGYGNATTDPYAYFNNITLPIEKSMIVGYNFTLAKKIVAFLQNESKGPSTVQYVTIFGNARMVPPSYYYLDQEFYLFAYLGFSDFYDSWIPTDAMYASPNYNSTHFSYTPTFMVGRIPVDPMTANITVNKIIHYGTTKTAGIQNVTLSGGQVFETPYFLGETGVLEPLNYGWLEGANVTEYFHTLRNFTYNNFMKMMNNSDMIVEITHGSGFSFWHHNDEVSAWDFPMTGAYGSLPVYVSGSCLNGAWDEGMYPSYEMSSGINGGVSIAEKMLYSPKGIIAYFGADREALGSTWAYWDNGTLVAPNDFGDLITEDGTIAGYYIGAKYYGTATIGLMGYYARAEYAAWIPYLADRDAAGDGLNDNPWGRSYFEYSVLGDPALNVSSGLGTNPSYKLPSVSIPNATYDANDMPIVTRDKSVTVKIRTDAPNVRAELLYLEQNYGFSPYAGTVTTYYDYVLNMSTLTPVSSSGGVNNFTYSFTPNREGMYILSVYTPDGKNTRFYMDCQMPTPPAIHLALKEKHFMSLSNFKATMNVRATAPDLDVLTLIDNGQLMYGENTTAYVLIYNKGNAPAKNVTVNLYLENYTLVFQSKNLSHPLVSFGNKTISDIPAGGYVYVNFTWKPANLWVLNHTWDPFNSSARWQYLVASVSDSGDSDLSNNANWALLHVSLPVDVWAQKMFLQKDPVLNESNNVTIELTNVGTSVTSNSTVYLMDDYTVFAEIPNVKIAPGQTVFYTVPWTPKHGGNDDLGFEVLTPGDNNTRNNMGMYYTNGYYGVTSFVVLTYDIAPVNATAKDTSTGTEIGLEIYNHGPLNADVNTTVNVHLYAGIYSTDVESPHPYPDMYTHTWTIHERYGVNGMALHFSYLMVEPGYDYVYIYDAQHNLVAEYTGFHFNLWTPFVHSSVLYVELKSDEAVHYNGFYIDAVATQYLNAGNVTFGAINNGAFATKILSYNTYKIAGTIGIVLKSSTPGEEATLTTGGAFNNEYYTTAYVLDTSTPVLTPVYPVGPVNNPSPVIKVNYKDAQFSGFQNIWINVTSNASGYMVSAAKIEYTGVNNGTITGILPPFNLADGNYTATVTVIDGGGNKATVTWSFVIDTNAPKLEISTPVNVPLTYTASFWINGTTEQGASVTINGEKVSVDATGAFSYHTTLVSGQNVFVVKATDAAGNSAEVRVTALYLPELKELWANITEIYKELGNLTGAVNNLNTEVSSLQEQVNALKDELNSLQNALSENVTMLEKAIKDNKTAVIKMVNENITKINDEIQDIKENQIPALKNEIMNAQDKNKEQDGAIGISDMIGVLGIILALVAIVLAVLGIRKKTSFIPNTVPEEKEDGSPEEEELEEI